MAKISKLAVICFLALVTFVDQASAGVRRKRQMGYGMGGMGYGMNGMGGGMYGPFMGPVGYGGGYMGAGGAGYQSGFACGSICGHHLRRCNLPCAANFWTYTCAACVGLKWDSCRHCFGGGNGAQTGMFSDWGYV